MRGSRIRAGWSLAVLGIALAGCARKPGVPLEMLTWDRDFPPHRVAGNVYFVGRKNVGIFLITTPAGHILLDSGFEASVPAVQASVQQLGFRFQDIKYLLASLERFLQGERMVVLRDLWGPLDEATPDQAEDVTGGQELEEHLVALACQFVVLGSASGEEKQLFSLVTTSDDHLARRGAPEA